VLAAAVAGLAAIAVEGASRPRAEPPGELLVRVGDPPLTVAIEDVGADPGGAAIPLRLETYEPERVVESLSGALEGEPALSGVAKLVETLHAISVSVERVCPPPGLLGCRPGLRVAARLGEASPRSISRRVGEIVCTGLRHVGFRDLRVRSSADGSGLVRFGNESVDVAEWIVEGDTLRIAVGGLEIDAAALAAPPPLDRPADGARPRTRVRIDPRSLAALVPSGIPRLR
jgi:hypothetical protein